MPGRRLPERYSIMPASTWSRLQSLAEGYPEGRFTIQRFRPNIVVDSAGETGFVENSWVGHTLAIGPELVVRISIPCPRCVMTTLPRADLPLDPGILRTAAQLNKQNLGDFGELPCVGVYADIVKPGISAAATRFVSWTDSHSIVSGGKRGRTASRTRRAISRARRVCSSDRSKRSSG